MEELKINTSTQVNKLAALDQSKVINLADEERDQTSAKKETRSTRADHKLHKESSIAVNQLVEMANRFVQRFSTKIAFYYDPQNNTSKILVTEKETGKVIRQIPPEQMNDLIQKMEEIAGIIYNGRA